MGTRYIYVTLHVDCVCSYMATSGLDRRLKVWDLRTNKALHNYRLSFAASHLSFSQRGLLAAGLNNVVEVCL